VTAATTPSTPSSRPTSRSRPATAARKLPPQTAPTIGDRLSAKGVDWAWYSGGWSNADGDVNAPGWTNGTAPDVHRPRTPADRPRFPELPARTSCSSSTTSR
jgi:phospholipase C